MNYLARRNLLNCQAWLAAIIFTLSAGTTLAESGFLDDYSKLEPLQSQYGTELIYVAPDGYKRLAGYTAVMVDQPEILFSADSDYRGMKPEDLQALASAMREVVKERLAAGGYRVVEQPDPEAVYLRLGLTDLYVKKKQRHVLAYTPVGAVVKAGRDLLKETLDKVDIIEMTLEVEFADSSSGDVIGAFVSKRGARKAAGQKQQRMDMEQFRATIREYAARLHCQLDNAKLPEAKWIDCSDPKARQSP
jgi:Protein of unknown function (DUF3313)